jgi:hypothetical protein
MEFSAEKSFEKSFFQEIPRNFPRKVIFRGKKCTKIGGDFSYIFVRGKFCRKFSPKKCWEKMEFSAEKKFRKIVFPRNSTEFTAESDFPWKKCTKNPPLGKKLSPGGEILVTPFF